MPGTVRRAASNRATESRRWSRGNSSACCPDGQEGTTVGSPASDFEGGIDTLAGPEIPRPDLSRAEPGAEDSDPCIEDGVDVAVVAGRPSLSDEVCDGEAFVRRLRREPVLGWLATVGHPHLGNEEKPPATVPAIDRKSTRLNSSHLGISY